MHLFDRSFLTFIFLLILRIVAITSQDEKEQKSEDILRQIAFNNELTYSAFQQNEYYSAFRKNHPEFSNREKDRTNEILFGSGDDYKIRFFRTKRSPRERSLESIRKKLNEERKKEREEMLMAADANPRMETNDTLGFGKHSLASYRYGKYCISVQYPVNNF